MRMSISNRISLAILLTAFAPLAYWGRMEGAEFPRHINFLTGSPDVWGTRNELFILLGIATLIYVLLVLSCKYPQIMNYNSFRLGKFSSGKVTVGKKEKKKEKEKEKEKLYPLGIELAQRMNIIMMMLFSLTTNCSSLIAIGVIEKFPVYCIWISLGGILWLTIKFTLQVRKMTE